MAPLALSNHHAACASRATSFAGAAASRARLTRARCAVASRAHALTVLAAAKRVLVPIGNGSEEMEASVMVDVLRRAGAEVTLASVETDLQCVMSRQMKFVADCFITECKGQEYDLVALPGGMPGAERLRDSEPLQAILKQQAAAGLPYAAICAAPVVVLNAQGLLSGLAATAHPAFSDQLEGSSTAGRVVADGNVITSRGPGTAIEFTLALVELLYGKEKALEVAGPMVIPPTTKAEAVANEWSLSP